MALTKTFFNSLISDFFIVVLILVCIPLIYFITVNTVLKNTVLPNVSFMGENISLQNEDEVINYNDKIYESIPEFLIVYFNNETYNVPTKELNPRINVSEIVDYGKGDNILDVINSGIDIALDNSKDFDRSSLTFEGELVLNYLPLNLSNELEEYAFIENDYINNCESKNIYSNIDTQELNTQVKEAIINDEDLILDLSTIISLEDLETFNLCLKYLNEKELINTKLSEEEISINDFSNVFGLNVNAQKWEIKNKTELTNLLKSYSLKIKVNPNEGKYEIFNSSIYLLEPYSYGRILNVDSSFELIENWIVNPLDELNLAYSDIAPEILTKGIPIYDFTQEISVGKTRIDVIRNGAYNIGVYFAEQGLAEIDYRVVMPGEEFSYIKELNPQPNGLSKDGRPIGGGICNATTTLFRAVLEAGLPITERSYHYYNYESYSWGYPENIVDAAYLTNPVVDFRFKNDYNYPILLRSEIIPSNDGYQYHNIYIYTSSLVVDREVELSNFKKWNIVSKGQFEGSFIRTIKENGTLIKQEEFYSRYFD